jgi:LEA14-like dessication related protein
MSRIGKIIIFSLIAILIAVISYLVTQLMKISKADLVYAGMKIKSVSFSKINLTLYFKIINTGSATVTLSNQEYDVYLNGKFVSHMKYSTPFIISPGENILPLEVTVGLADAIKAGLSNLSDIINDKSKINVSLKGKRSMKIGFLSFNNVTINETINLGSLDN